MNTDHEILVASQASQSTEKKHEKKKKKKKKGKSKATESDADDGANNGAMSVKVQVVPEDPGKVPPLVGYFPTGFNPHRDGEGDDVGGGEGNPYRSKVRVFRSTRRQGRLELVVSPEGSNVIFVGTSYSGEATCPQQCTYALGVLDKEAGTLKIVPVASNKIFRLEPRISGSSDVSAEIETTPVKEHNTEDKLDKLTNRFGTTKGIRKIKKRKFFLVNDNPDAENDEGKKLEGVEINKDALESATTFVSSNIPPHDPCATSPQMAYPLEKIILKGEWDYLLDIFELLQEGQKVSPPAYPVFVCNRIRNLKGAKDEEKRKLACMFSYITHLLKFKDMHSMDGFSSAKDHKIPGILFHKFKSLFADPGSKFLSKEKNGLIVRYILVLTLITDEFFSDPTDISSDLRTTSIQLRSQYEELGCKFARQNKVLYATLPVPLKFPQLISSRRRK